jgi:hypothetical protein
MPPHPTPRLFRLNLTQARAALNRTESRREPRRAACYLVRIHWPFAPEQPPELAPLWNVAPSGIGLLFDRPLDRGQVLEVQFGRAAIPDRLATVVHASAKGTTWLVGCTLDESLSASELRELAE